MYRPLAPVILVALLACESNEKKLSRLEGDRTMYCLLEQSYREKYEAARFPGGITLAQTKNRPHETPASDSLRRSYLDYHTKCELATREYNRFMR
jgi:hypothetical protein